MSRICGMSLACGACTTHVTYLINMNHILSLIDSLQRRVFVPHQPPEDGPCLEYVACHLHVEHVIHMCPISEHGSYSESH